jgi:hypothetical protein
MSRRFPRPWSIVLEPLPQYRLSPRRTARRAFHGFKSRLFPPARHRVLRASPARSLNHADKEHWLKIAEEWLKMAQQADLTPE